MANTLRLEVLLAAIDKASGPFRKIAGGASAAADAVRKSKVALSDLEKKQSDTAAYTKARWALRGTAVDLRKHAQASTVSKAALETQLTAQRALAVQAKVGRAEFRQQARVFAGIKQPSAEVAASFEAQRKAITKLEATYAAHTTATRALQKEDMKSDAVLKKLTRTHESQGARVEATRQKLEAAGLSTNKLGARQRELRSEVKRANDAIALQTQRAEKLARTQERLAKTSAKMTRGGMMMAAHGAGAYAAGNIAMQRMGQVAQPGIDLQAQMRNISITGGFDKAQESALTEQVRADALKFGQTADLISSGLNGLVANGESNVQQLGIYSGLMAKTSVAAGVEMADLSQLITTNSQTFDIVAKDMAAAFDSMNYAGKRGSFEMADMAKWFPALAPQVKALGVTGLDAVASLGAALQVARKGAGSNDEAANNFSNYLSQLTAPNTIKAFDKAGIDLEKSMLGMARKGIDPLQGSLELITRYMDSKGPAAAKKFKDAISIEDAEKRAAAMESLSDAFNLGELFRDKQVLNFLRPALANQAEMQSIKQGASTASGGIDADWVARMETAQKKLDLFQIKLSELKLRAFDTLGPSLVALAEKAGVWLDKLGRFVKENPVLASTLMKVAAGFAALLVAVGAILIPLGLVVGAVGHLVAAWGVVTGASAAGAAATGAAASGVAASGAALSALALPLLLVAAAGLLIWKYWQPIKAFLGGMWDGFLAGIQPVMPVLSMLGETLGSIFSPAKTSEESLANIASIGKLVGQVLGGLMTVIILPLGLALQGIAEIFKFVGERIGATIGFLVTGVSAFGTLLKGIFTLDGPTILAGFQAIWQNLNQFFGGLPAKLAQVGINMVQGLVNGILSMLGAPGKALAKVADSAIGKLRGLLGIRSPSRVFAELGGFTMQGFTDGLQAGARGPLGALDAMGERMRKAGAGIALGTLSVPAMAAVDALPPQSLDVLPQLQALTALPAMRVDVLPHLRGMQPLVPGDDQDAADDDPAFPRVDPRPPLAAAAPGRAAGSGGNTYHINITAPPGGNAQDIARLVRDEIERLEHHRRVRHRSEMSDYE